MNSHYRQRRTEHFFGHDLRLFVHVHQNGRQIKVTLLECSTVRTRAAGENMRSAFDRVANLLLDFGALSRSMHWPDKHALLEAVPDFQLFDARHQPGNELIEHVVENIEPLDRETR